MINLSCANICKDVTVDVGTLSGWQRQITLEKFSFFPLTLTKIELAQWISPGALTCDTHMGVMQPFAFIFSKRFSIIKHT